MFVEYKGFQFPFLNYKIFFHLEKRFHFFVCLVERTKRWENDITCNLIIISCGLRNVTNMLIVYIRHYIFVGWCQLYSYRLSLLVHSEKFQTESKNVLIVAIFFFFFFE